MAIAAQNPEPADAAARRAIAPVTVYTLDRLAAFDRTFYDTVRSDLTPVEALTVPPRDARAFEVPAGHLFRIVTPEGAQVGDLNLWNGADLPRALLQRQDPCPARHPRQHRRPAVEHPAMAAPDGDHHPRHPGLVRHRRVRRRRA